MTKLRQKIAKRDHGKNTAMSKSTRADKIEFSKLPPSQRGAPGAGGVVDVTQEIERVTIESKRERYQKEQEERELHESKDEQYYKEVAPGISINPALSLVNRQQVVVTSGTDAADVSQANELAVRFGLDYVPLHQLQTMPQQLFTYQLALAVASGRLSLNDLELYEGKSGGIRRKMTCEVTLDFTSGELFYKIKERTFAKSPMVRSVRCPEVPATVLDVTGGLGKDAWVIASFGSKVTVVERNPILHYFLECALDKARKNPATKDIAARITLIKADSVEYLCSIINREPSEQPDVIYMDPMYLSKSDSAKQARALSKKDIRAIRKLVGGDRESKLLFALSKRIAQKRIVWKKPKTVAPIIGIDTHYSSSDTRFDVFITATKKVVNPANGAETTTDPRSSSSNNSSGNNGLDNKAKGEAMSCIH
ncbi:hypothetical protein SAMD00019534_003430 [Acytostelium subglobosum LB1]|uniref:hypothetical protein n=1 Tax=Acytostelium subglobosum LB1 TaxID=1410327 RepID=UPI00064488CA|nr:hypothetical protein SAMD00019534_003430 [Acytostelium subglobosum LB1]GAM17168.1 hypothetical protein SAMD00019534_003430 [Acytostelium subglobosum LB1]|eukprot:XP_012759230.1 hypothetical protein SAMD00019534_003430 [Acytostelium subglobosum LB1]